MESSTAMYMEQQQAEQQGSETTPSVDALNTPITNCNNTTKNRKIPQETLRKMKTQSSLIRQLQEQLLMAQEALLDSEQNKAELNALLHASLNPTQRRTTETPGPHRLQERPPRPEDLEYQDKLRTPLVAVWALWFFVEKLFSKLMTIMTVCSCRRTFICNSIPSQRLSCLSKREMFHIIRWIRCMW
jgi:hypothetical protein